MLALVFLAASATPVFVSLDDALERARANAPSLESLRALERSAEAERREARAGRLPTVDLAAGYARSSNVPELTVPFPDGDRTLFPNLPNTWRSRVEASVPLYVGGRVSRTIDAAEARRTAAASDTDAGALDLELETRIAYWSLATARDRVRVLTDAMRAYDQHLADARHREELGLVPHSEVLSVSVERDRAELTRVEARNAAAVEEADLARILGLPPGSTIELTDPLDAPEPTPIDLEVEVARALESRPERAALAARRRALEAAAAAERGARLPAVAAAAGYDYARPNRKILPLADRWDDTWDVSVSATWRAFDGGKSKAAQARRSAEAESVTALLEDFDRRVRRDVTARVLDVSSARDAIEVAERAETAAREALRIVADRYVEGVAPSSDRLDAEVALLRSGLDRAEAAARLRTALAALDRATGR